MTDTPRPAGETRRGEPDDFSLVLGGPLYQLFRKLHVAGSALEQLPRRMLALSLLAWLPLLVLSAADGQAWDGVALPFLGDIDTHVRFLVSMPLLVAAELFVHRRMRTIVGQFAARGLVPENARAKFDGAVSSAMRLRNSLAAELALLAFVYGVGVMLVWRTHTALDVTAWYGAGGGGELQPTRAGWWFGVVSLPLYQFLLLRWYFRLFIWGRFLWQVSRLELRLVPTHPDRAGGLGFLASVCGAFTPLLLAQGALFAGTIANKIFVTGAKLPEFKIEIVCVTLVALLFVVGPLLVFIPVLARARRTATREYGLLAMGYVREFDEKWLRGGRRADEALMGSADIQSLADLGNAYGVVKEMRIVPFPREMLVQLAVTSLLPLAPLLLTMVSVDELINRLVGVVF